MCLCIVETAEEVVAVVVLFFSLQATEKFPQHHSDCFNVSNNGICMWMENKAHRLFEWASKIQGLLKNLRIINIQISKCKQNSIKMSADGNIYFNCTLN